MSRKDSILSARKMVARAKSLTPSFSEVYRVSGIVETRAQDLYRAQEELETAIQLAGPGGALARYQYALFLKRELDDM